ncbi:choline ABC transporter permease [Ktedonobacter sp. SOSP1-85]|uniref:ABC transporter permease n=1 Tax=Ktedonobacter sp. SOSP1-85 TaxID=2778367 RepID=UPI001916256F|nr:ABC transporter permease [Ktedonobacter sp. SOSP1-85]GHO79820.1 choline ABC transporter permease [Ktedonobacter sp. SOSP1-85]
MNQSDFWSMYGNRILEGIGPHLFLTGVSLGLGILFAVPLGILLTRFPRWSGPIIAVVSVLQTIPSLAFFALALPYLGIGMQPALVVLFLYSLLPILRNTYVGVRAVDATLIDAARGQGMTNWEILYLVELPLAAPVIVTGIRLAAVYLVSWATLASLIGAGGLGDLIFAGLDSYDANLLMAGAIPTAMLALLIGFVFGLVRRLVTPRGIRKEVRARWI